MDRRIVGFVVVALLVGTVVCPWVEAWPVDDPGAWVLAEPVNRYGDYLPRVAMVPLWDQGAFARVHVFWPAILLQMAAILLGGGWAAYGVGESGKVGPLG